MFTVRLPSVPARTPAPHVASPGTAASARRRIFVIDDNDEAREMLRVALTRAGHEVYEAADGYAEIAKKCAPDVALIDVGPPGLDRYRAGAGSEPAPMDEAGGRPGGLPRWWRTRLVSTRGKTGGATRGRPSQLRVGIGGLDGT